MHDKKMPPFWAWSGSGNSGLMSAASAAARGGEHGCGSVRDGGTSPTRPLPRRGATPGTLRGRERPQLQGRSAADAFSAACSGTEGRCSVVAGGGPP